MNTDSDTARPPRLRAGCLCRKRRGTAAAEDCSAGARLGAARAQRKTAGRRLFQALLRGAVETSAFADRVVLVISVPQLLERQHVGRNARRARRLVVEVNAIGGAEPFEILRFERGSPG